MIERERLLELNSHLPDVKALLETRAAIQVLTRAARKPGPHVDPVTPFFMGGPLAFTEAEYVNALLHLANAPTAFERFERKLPQPLTAEGYPDERYLQAKERAQLIALLNRIIDSQTRENIKLPRDSWRRKVVGHIVSIPSLGVADDVILADDGDAAKNYVYLLLADVERQYLMQLRRCEFEKCQRFFLDTQTRPGQRRLYCEGRTCATDAEKSAARIRAQLWREAKKKSSRKQSTGRST